MYLCCQGAGGDYRWAGDISAGAHLQLLNKPTLASALCNICTSHTQVPGVTPTSGLSGGAYTLTLAQLGWNGTDILTFWRAIVNEGKTRLGSGVLGRLNALSVVSSC
jgi:hypothetical protein